MSGSFALLLQSPFQTITAAVDGDVLAVLSADRSFTVMELSRMIPHRSYPGVSNAVLRLVEQGIVLLERAGRTRTVRLNREHLVAEAVVAIATTRTRFLERLRAECETLPVDFGAMFGSAARGEMRSDSDIDLFFVRAQERAGVDERIFEVVRRVTMWTGNDARPVIYDDDDIRAGDPLLRSIQGEGIPIVGPARWLHRRMLKMSK